MPSLIAHIPDWDAFVAEMLEKGLARQEDGEPICFLIDNTFFVHKGDEALVNIYNHSAVMANMSSVDMLGDINAILNAPPKREIYDRIYPRTPVNIIDDEGVGRTYIPPTLFCGFGED